MYIFYGLDILIEIYLLLCIFTEEKDNNRKIANIFNMLQIDNLASNLKNNFQ